MKNHIGYINLVAVIINSFCIGMDLCMGHTTLLVLNMFCAAFCSAVVIKELDRA